jgi:hypothetical protein
MHPAWCGRLVFGVGWALSGACPGTALAQLGEGKLYALATVARHPLGTWLRDAPRFAGSPRRAVRSCTVPCWGASRSA